MFNGDIGVLEEVDRASASMTIRFEDRVALYTAEAAVDLELAYATTVHKSQGSEFEAVSYTHLRQQSGLSGQPRPFPDP